MTFGLDEPQGVIYICLIISSIILQRYVCTYEANFNLPKVLTYVMAFVVQRTVTITSTWYTLPCSTPLVAHVTFYWWEYMVMWRCSYNGYCDTLGDHDCDMWVGRFSYNG